MAEVPARFVELISTVTGRIAGFEVSPALGDRLQAEFAPGSPVFDELEQLCREGCEAGWLCQREAGGIRFGRPVKPSPATHGFSVDVVEMDSVIGPHHTHPGGEIDMVMPVDPAAQFDGSGRGWKVYEAGSAHHPTVAGGKALVLYLLPEGAIEFTRG